MRTALGALCALVLMLGPAWAADWRQVSSSDSYLWYDDASVDVDDDGYLTMAIYRGAWAGADSMSATAISLSVDCIDGYYETYNRTTGKWEEAPSGLITDALDDLAYGICYDD